MIYVKVRIEHQEISKPRPVLTTFFLLVTPKYLIHFLILLIYYSLDMIFYNKLKNTKPILTTLFLFLMHNLIYFCFYSCLDLIFCNKLKNTRLCCTMCT